MGHIRRVRGVDMGHRDRLLQGASTSGVNSYMNERTAIHDAHSIIDGMIAQGTAVVTRMGIQNETLKNAKRKVLDVANQVGLSASLIGVIERRHTIDWWIIIGLIIFTLSFFFFLWKFVRG
eukprot:GHVR01134206.1.p1 GENE.GHVR01134206.1~~GHVR01134206.1.p1  ORF type:complete len:121 (+),score=22.87 GHVR01134206.1:428-790(+)